MRADKTEKSGFINTRQSRSPSTGVGQNQEMIDDHKCDQITRQTNSKGQNERQGRNIRPKGSKSQIQTPAMVQKGQAKSRVEKTRSGSSNRV